VPDAPTFGVKIGLDRNTFHENASLGQYLGAAFGAMMSFSDNDFIVQHPDYRHLVGFIDSGDYNWLDFSISDEGKLDLFVRGAKAAATFLKGFDWEKYKEGRLNKVSN
jgi:NTE family protein